MACEDIHWMNGRRTVRCLDGACDRAIHGVEHGGSAPHQSFDEQHGHVRHDVQFFFHGVNLTESALSHCSTWWCPPDFSCAWDHKVVMHGRMYVTDEMLCFYANFFGLEAKMTLR